jgi:hypothetical protein
MGHSRITPEPWATVQAAAMLRNGRRALTGRLRLALGELAVTIERIATVVAQARSRLAGQMPDPTEISTTNLRDASGSQCWKWQAPGCLWRPLPFRATVLRLHT